MNTKGLKISPRALALAMQNRMDISQIVPTGPDGRIIERDVWRALEQEYVKDTPDTSAAEEPATKEVVDEEMTAESVATENTIAELIPGSVTFEEIIETPETEEIAVEETVEAPETEEIAVEETVEEPKTEEIAAEEIIELLEAEVLAADEADEESEIEIEIIVEESEPVAMIAAPVTGVKTEEPKEEPQAEIKDKSYAYGTDAYRHTDVIIPRTDKAPDGTPFTVTMSFDASAVVRLHRMMKENGDSMGLPHITINDMILFAVSKHLKKNKALNAHFLGDKIRYFDGVHLGFVVDTGHGMETPTVFDADRLSLASLSKITGALVRGARAGNVSPEKNKLCASFMVSNLGMLGVEAFNPVLQAPQTGILGVSALQKRLKEVNGQDISYPAIPLSLTFDPRAIDTTGAVKFLSSLCSALENFELLLIK